MPNSKKSQAVKTFVVPAVDYDVLNDPWHLEKEQQAFARRAFEQAFVDQQALRGVGRFR